MGEKRQQDRIRYNKNNILETAKKLFVEKGIEQTTMSDIAKTADYSKSTIYVYFKSKDDIFHHILFEHMSALKDGLKNCIDQNISMEDTYAAICATLIDCYNASPLFFESLLKRIEVSREAIEAEPILGEIYLVGEEVNNIIEEFILRGINEHKIRSDIKVLPTVFMMWASLCENIIMAEDKKEYIAMQMKLSKEEYLQYVFSTLLQSICL